MLGRLLDDSDAPEVRANITLITLTRLTAASGYRFAIPFLAVIARGLDVSVAEFGVALTVGELTGLAGPALGRFMARAPRRKGIVGGLAVYTLGVSTAALAPGLAIFAAGLVVLGLGKMVFDLSLLSWISDHVPMERRGRVIGITEISWAASLFVGVTVLGAVTALWSWRWGYAVVALVTLGLIAAILGRVPADPPRPAERLAPTSARVPRSAFVWIAGMGFMLMASQLMLVVLGPWLEDDHGLSEAGITVVVFGLGFVELLSSIAAIRLTDRWGGPASVRRGALLILPAAAVFAAGHGTLAVGLAGVALMVLGFEYAIVSSVSVASGLVSGAAAAGVGVMLAAGTLGRAAGSIVGTWLYDEHGAVGPAAAAVAAASAMAVLLWVGQPTKSAGFRASEHSKSC